MRIYARVLAVVAVGAAFLSACSRSEPPSPSASDIQRAAERTASKVTKAARSAADAAKTGVQGAVAEANEAVDNATTQVSSRAQMLIGEAKSLIAEKKYQEALAPVQELDKLKLAPDQEKLLANLKEQLEEAMAGQASRDPARAAGNVINR